MHTPLCCISNYDDFLKEKHLCDYLSCKLNQSLFPPWAIIFYLKEEMTNSGYLDLGIRQTFFFQNELSEPVQGKQLTVFAAKNNIEFSGKNQKSQNFGKPVDSFPSLKDFFDKLMVVLQWLIFKDCIMRCVNMWKMSITQ